MARRGNKCMMAPLNTVVSRLDKRFIDYCSQQLGISKGEFVRRILATAQEQWILNGLYPMEIARPSVSSDRLTTEPTREK